MARQKAGLWSKYRRASNRLAELEAQRAELQRSRPRTRGKKAAKTRALTKLARQIPSAKGLLTKARQAIARAASARSSHNGAAKQKRSEAARRGWVTRRARKAAMRAHTPAPGSHQAMPFLTREKGVVGVWPPSKADRSKVNKYWSMVDRLLSNQPASFEHFENDSIYDEISGKHLPFVTDRDFIYAHSDEFDFGISFYKDRHEFANFA
jgi:hypothetical protein